MKFFFFFTLFFSPFAFSATIIIKRDTRIYSQPSFQSKPVLKLKKGRRLSILENEKNGFYQLKTKSGRQLWISKSVVNKLASPEDDLVSPPSSSNNRNSQRKRFSYDLGISAGSSGDVNYNEVNLGLNYSIYNWLIWRNAFFYRFSSDTDSIWGLDSSIRAYYFGRLASNSSLTLFAGPGARVPSEGDTTPFAEAGAIVKLSGFSLGGGAKTIFNSFNDNSLENDTQYFIILSGGGSF